MKVLLWITALSAAFAQAPAEKAERIVTLGGGATEVVFALGAGDRVVGVDSTSTYPAEVDDLPDVGVYRQVGAEGILSLRPDLVIASAETGPPSTLSQLRSVGVRVELLPGEPSLEGAEARIERAGALLGREEEAHGLVQALRGALETIDRSAPSQRVLFIYARGAGSLSVAGLDTAASAMIQLAGGTPAITQWTGYRPLTAEGLVAAAPEVILLTSHGLASLGGEEGLWATPGLSLTPAGKARRLVVVDDGLLLGMGPRLGEAAVELHQRLHAQ